MARIRPSSQLGAEKDTAIRIAATRASISQESSSEPAKTNSTRRRNQEWNGKLPARPWEEVIRDIAREGFLRRNSISKNFAERLTDPMFVNPPARLSSIGGVRAAHRGGVKFSTVDFFGKELSHRFFLVVNEEKFNAWAASRLEAMFRAENPHPGSRLAAAFTHYMHESHLHWSGCTERKQNNTTFMDECC